MIRVCDALPGSGKTSAAINYINEHPNEKYFYIVHGVEDSTNTVNGQDEVSRITSSCPGVKFYDLRSRELAERIGIRPYDRWDVWELMDVLIREGASVIGEGYVCSVLTRRIIRRLKEQGYILIIDEFDGELVTKYDLDRCWFAEKNKKIDSVSKNPWFIFNEEKMVATGVPYSGKNEEERVSNQKSFEEDFFTVNAAMSTRDLEVIKLNDKEDDILKAYFPVCERFLNAFKDVFILTYMFEAQGIYQVMKIYDIPYEHIGIEIINDGKFNNLYGMYRFGKPNGYIPDYYYNLDKLLTICQDEEINKLGEDDQVLTIDWFDNSIAGLDKLIECRNRYVYNGTGTGTWTTFQESHAACRQSPKLKMATGSFSRCPDFIGLDIRNTLHYGNFERLFFAANLYRSEYVKQVCQKYGIDSRDDDYITSILVQLIWRTAIRHGEPVEVCIPSKRMRELLEKWIKKVPYMLNLMKN